MVGKHTQLVKESLQRQNVNLKEYGKQTKIFMYLGNDINGQENKILEKTVKSGHHDNKDILGTNMKNSSQVNSKDNKNSLNNSQQ